MQTIKSDLLKNYELTTACRKYHQDLSPLLADKFDVEDKLIKKYLTSVGTHTTLMEKLFDSESKTTIDELDRLTSIYKHTYDSIVAIKRMMSLVQQPYLQPINIRADFSQTKIMELQDDLRQLRLKYARFTKTWNSLEVALINMLQKKAIAIVVRIDAYEAAVHLQTIFHKSPSIISLYATIMQTIVDNLYGSNNKVMNKVLQLLEDDKNFYLIPTNYKLTSKKNIHLTNPPINKFNLLPVTKSMSLSELFTKIIPKQTNGKISMSKYAKDNSVGFIVMHRVVYNPMEYSVRSVIKPEDKSLTQPVEYGVTEKTIKRFNTIQQMIPEAKWNFGTELIGDVAQMRAYFVIETLDGKTYRALAPWFESNTYAVPTHKLKALIAYITQTNKPTRISEYQKLKTSIAIKNMFLPKKIDLSVLSDKSIHIDMQQIQNALYESVMSVIKLNIKIKYTAGTKIKSNTDLNQIIHDTDISDAFYQIILRKYDVGTKLTKAQRYSAGDFPFSELLVSYIRELRSITIRFMKELHNGYNRAPLPNDVFKLSKKEMVKSIMDRLESIVEKAVLITVHHKNNIYSDMTYKYFLLNYT